MQDDIIYSGTNKIYNIFKSLVDSGVYGELSYIEGHFSSLTFSADVMHYRVYKKWSILHSITITYIVLPWKIISADDHWSICVKCSI